ncbi:CPBP family intramembrane glutamic endopeptidase [Haloarculaceae archaeon H-GB2-1]|nr:CPBP family intramembrane metalloprotease [Haloarculaceae archaeon H-GB1-1]MEA5389260.1 CPBP family intramembrane glutamic endopeptidase [Haloarculaceae archaeon H-GB11]MEA5409925.1 CPBP family intramembrane glutamic endopeptidase [Haloarculaceae archaeon H-GB2-1]
MLRTTTPIFQMFWLIVPLISLVRHRDTDRVGFRIPDRGQGLQATIAAGIAYAILLILVEPWSGVYDRLLALALEGPDPTFAWLVRLDGVGGWVGLALFSGFVTLYSEELFFRGWLIQALNRRTKPRVAVAGQAVVFTIFQSIPIFFFAPLQAALYLLVYAFGLGVILGVAAQRTQSIWPGLAVVTVANLVLTAILI